MKFVLIQNKNIIDYYNTVSYTEINKQSIEISGGESEMQKKQTNTKNKPVEIKADPSILASINDYYSKN